MAKFYVQCGPVECVLLAETPQSAAMSALDKLLQAHLWIYDDPGLREQDCRSHLMLEALMHLEPSVRVSERGFDRDDAIHIGTPETVDQWHRLMVAMQRLFVAAGLGTRSVVSFGGGEESEFQAPRIPR